jgi:exosortase A-associated hydrolase 1
MSYTEQIVIFACQGEQLVGIVSLPTVAETAGTQVQTPGVVIIVGGPQYRAGSHRQFVLLARALASTGTPVLRFDYRGMGDSTGGLHTFENVNEDIAAGIDALQMAAPNVQNVALWGLCDGASAALLYCHAAQDKRVKGLCLLNPWVRSAASLAKTQVKHYYTQRLRQKEFWVKLLNGKVAVSAASGLIRNVKTALSGQGPKLQGDNSQPFQSRMALGWEQFKGNGLLILSGDDYTAKEFLEYAGADAAWTGAIDRHRLSRFDVPEADHTFSDILGRKLVENKTVEWMQSVERKSHDD